MITTVTANAAIDKTYHVKRIALHDVNRVAEVVAVPGGKGINVAKVARTLGARVTASGFLGGTNGQFIHQGIEQRGIASDFVRVEGNSRETIAILDEAGGTPTELLEPGPVVAEAAQHQLAEKIAALAKASKVVVFSGSLPRGVPADFYAALIQAAKREGALTILDASGEPLARGIDAAPAICKPNREEIGQLLGYRPDSRRELLRAAAKLIDKGVQAVIVSMDREGAIAVTAHAAWHIAPPPIEAVNSVGCGDAMVAGIACHLDRGGSALPDELPEALRLGTAAAASNALHREAGFVRLQEVTTFLPKVRITRL
ncbi:1-phosphofructokinase [Brevibacillus sp. SYP-B805]|uniref:1-phosphofructokinase n=1 Tax=Brevibacillus sp. SYP-B805 TaxID=1578199 RepID=UPI0013EA88B0|nr:1-phosphofructokinase [Brevibacillus sp. SYP-B805]NGQ96696.1 1-phosphofructokinase [Brevibacillus sp. SYP-B805]